MNYQTFQAPRGTNDILPIEQKYWRYIDATVSRSAKNFGYERIDTPIFEDAGLFVRSVGKVTDIIEKETYTFEDRGGDLLSLRPEGTAPVCRAYLEHGMHNMSQPVRLYYSCPMFRYDRPQAGRYRELNQFGVEVIGDGDSSVDAEVIDFGWNLLQDIGLENLTLLVNSIGDPVCKSAYIVALKQHYEKYLDDLKHEECRRRLDSNPLRLLDCKEKSCQQIVGDAPRSVDYLCEECSLHWTELLGYLKDLGIPYLVDSRLVRGLDYYARTVFEIVPSGAGSQGTILAGGRYDGLIEQLGGSPTPGIGFATGIERIILNLKTQKCLVPDQGGKKVVVAHKGDVPKKEALVLTSVLRCQGISAVLAPAGRSLKSQLRYASSIKATHAVIIGDREIETGSLVLRDLSHSAQSDLSRDELIDTLTSE